MHSDEGLPLGKKVAQPETPDIGILYPILRSNSALRTSWPSALEYMQGQDIWHCYELNWLDKAGRPYVGIGTLIYDAHSTHLVESKSLKLYLGSFFNTRIGTSEELATYIQQDLHKILGSKNIEFTIRSFEESTNVTLLNDFPLATCIDSELLNKEESLITTDNKSSNRLVEERLSSHILRSLCPVTGQPDYGSVEIHYSGPKINRSGLLTYLHKLRTHTGFHEEICESIFKTVQEAIKPTFLMVRCLFLRRGGIDICPVRFSTSYVHQVSDIRLTRQ